MLRFAVSTAVLLLFIPLAFPKSYQASRIDVELQVQAGGDLLVTEAVNFQFEGGPFTSAFREIRFKESDGLDQFQAFMDGEELRVGAGEVPGLELTHNTDSIRFTWRFAPTSDSSHTFILKYRALGAVRQDEGRDLLLWTAVPGDHPYRIQSGRVTVAWPPGVRMSGEPEANRKANFQTIGQTVAYETGPLDRNRGFSVEVPFVQGSILTQPPAWQQSAERRSAELRQAVATAIAIVAPLLLIFIMLVVRLRTARTIRPAPGPTVVTSPPDDLTPALVGALRGSWSDWRVALATLMDLGQRGFLEIEAQPKRWWTGREFNVRRKTDLGGLSGQEQVLLRLVFGSSDAYAAEVPLRKAQRNVWRRWRRFTDALRQEAREAGFLDPDRERTRRRWIATGGIMMLCALVGTGSMLIAFAPHGQLLPIAVIVAIGSAVFLLGFLVLILGSTLTRLTDAALARKQSWEAFRKHLKELASRKTQLHPEWLASYLPYAVVLGLGNQWAKAFKDRGVSPEIAWLVGSEQFDGSHVAALVAVLHTSGAGHSSPGGGTAGGGGGSSGAG